MTEILLTPPIPSASELERLNLFAGRHMGEDEFDRQQAYADRRLQPLLAGFTPGIVQGLEVRTTSLSGSLEGFTISPGLAIAGNGKTLGLYYSLRETWATLIADYLKQSGAASAAGVFYLTLKRSLRQVDTDPDTLPDQRDEFDPTRDERTLVVGTLGLTRLAINAAVAATLPRELVENWVAANNADAAFMTSMKDAVPLGLLQIQDIGDFFEPAYIVNWFSPAVGQYRAQPNSGYRVLYNQTRDAFQRMVNAARAQEELSVAEYIQNNLRLDFLPAAGELPYELISNITDHKSAPQLNWLPRHIAVDMIPAPEETVAALIEQHLPRRVVDLRQPMGDRLRLLLAVNEPDFKPKLLDYPQKDAQLISDVFRYFARAHDAWRSWMATFNRLYYVLPDTLLDKATRKSLDLPAPVASPQLPQTFFAETISKSRITTSTPDPVYPYDEGIPAFPPFYQSWGTGNPVVPKPIVNPTENGYVIQYAIGRVDLEAIDNQVRALRSRVEKTRDFLLLQRQQLDSQTVSLAALAGGVAGDGSGLQVARWLPFTKLVSNKISTNPSVDNSSARSSAGADVAAEDAAANLKASDVLAKADFSKLVTTDFISLKANTSMNNTAQLLRTVDSKSNLGSGKNLVFSNTLRQSPTVFSNLQFNMNNLRLNRISDVAKQALTKPSFETKEFRFGVLEQIRPETQEYKKAVRGLEELITTIDGMFDKAEAATIKAKLLQYGKPRPYEAIEDEATSKKEEIAPKLYEELFMAGKILTKQIAFMESRYQLIEASLEAKLRDRINKESELEKIAGLIRATSDQLAGLDKRRIEFLGDYGVTQRLIEDDWLQVYKTNQERTRILTTAVKGVYYIRVLQTPIGQPLADPLLLRFGKAGDIVPGCDSSQVPDLPDDVDDFFDTVLEIPMSDWVPLQGLEMYLPLPDKLVHVEAQRNLRIQTKVAQQQSNNTANTSRTAQSVSLFGLRVQTQLSLHQFSKVPMPLAELSTKIRQQQAAKVISLTDLLSLKGPIQKQAQTLHNQLEQAVGCMLDKLNDLPPSIRLQWAQMAEDDRLPVDQVNRWPGLERAEQDDFNSTRTLAELVAWWFRQLSPNAVAASQTAMRNMIRAALIHASLGDPAEILHGSVQVPPRQLNVGEAMRLQLNRIPKQGTVLHLLDPQQRVVALLHVDDHDDKGSVAKVAQVYLNSASGVANRITTQYRVVATKATYQFGKLTQ